MQRYNNCIVDEKKRRDPMWQEVRVECTMCSVIEIKNADEYHIQYYSPESMEVVVGPQCNKKIKPEEGGEENRDTLQVRSISHSLISQFQL